MLFCVLGSAQQTPKQPNIIFILADDLGIGDIGVYGQSIIQTPHIDRLAEEGMKFNNFYAGSTVCAPSRAALLTGQHTGHTQVRGNGEFPLDPAKKIIPEVLKNAGYTNAIFGKWGMGLNGSGSTPDKRGFDVFAGHIHHVSAHYQKPDSIDAIVHGDLKRIGLPKDTYVNEYFTEQALQFINNQPKDKPFFLFMSYTIPHAELVVPPKYLQKHLLSAEQSKHDSEKEWPAGRHYGPQPFPKAAYAALVESLDDYTGQILAALKAKGIDENTIVIFTSDNGTHTEGGRTQEDVDYFGSSAHYQGVKRDLYTGGIKEPFLIRWPGTIPARTQSNHVSAFWDLYPTFAELAQVTLKESLDGISIVPTLTDKGKQDKHPYLYWEFHEFGGKQALLKGDWKIIRLDVHKNRYAPVALYNLKEDPSEKNDVSKKYPRKTKRLTELMDSVRTENENFNFKRQ